MTDIVDHRFGRRLIALVALVLASACGPKDPPLSQYDAIGLLERGLALYHEEEWSDAIRFLDQFVLENPNHERIQEARYYLADSYFGREEYIVAAGRFVRLAEDYPSGEWADDARFRTCEAYRELAPEPTLDQQYTQAAIDHCQALVIYSPESEFVPAAQEIVASMENRLARKAFLNGEFYRKRGAHDSALIYYESVLTSWPRSSVAPEALAAMVDSYDEIGYDEERDAARERLLREFPSSEAARELAGSGAGQGGAATAGTR